MMFSKKTPRVHETDNYLERDTTEAVAIAEERSHVYTILIPLVVGVMVGCIALSVAQFVRQTAPGWNATYFVIAPVLASLAGYATHRLGRERFVSRSERQRFQIFELATIFLLLKVATFMDNTIPEIWAEVRRWQDEPLLFLNLELVTSFILTAAGWFSGWLTTRDLEAIADPLLYKGETGPMERLNKRFTAGGVFLLVFSGIARIQLTTLFTPDPPHVGGLVLNVLVYFVLGLGVLGQVRFTWLRRLWTQQKFTIAGDVRRVWLQYSAILLGIALLIAFILPRQYTVGLLDIGRYILNAITFAVSLIVSLFALLMGILLALLFPKAEPVDTPLTLDFHRLFPPDAASAPGEPVSWWLLLRSILFWAIALGAIVYVIRSYLHDRPELLDSLKRFRLAQRIRSWWRAITAWWRGVRRVVREHMPAISLDFFRRANAHSAHGRARHKGQALREQVFYHYLDTLDHARDAGLPRHNTQTPYEYRSTLDPNLTGAHSALENLTETFVAARYSEHPITEEHVQHLKTMAKHVHSALDRYREAKEHEQK